ncbi:Rhodanese-like domain-containing protein 15, chloroplastic [Linum grandiflorum]
MESCCRSVVWSSGASFAPLLHHLPSNVKVSSRVQSHSQLRKIPITSVTVAVAANSDNSRRISRFCTKAVVGENLNAAAVPVPTSVPVRVAYELLLAGHRYLDVRTPEEFSAGHPEGAINVPYMYRVGSGLAKNPKFVEQVSSQFGKYNEIIVGCQLGKRSMMAATDLLAAGFMAVTDIAGGYAAWTQNSLPTEK